MSRVDLTESGECIGASCTDGMHVGRLRHPHVDICCLSRIADPVQMFTELLHSFGFSCSHGDQFIIVIYHQVKYLNDFLCFPDTGASSSLLCSFVFLVVFISP